MWQTIFPYIISLTVAAMIITLVFTVLHYIRYFRTNRDVRRAWHRAKGRQMFGYFLIAFSINQILLFNTVVTYIICAVLLFFAYANISYGIKASKYFEQYFDEEDEAWKALEQEQKKQ